jgi:hypothetical protein
MQQWQRILGLLLISTEAMQLCIGAALDSHRQQLLTRYTESIQNIEAPHIEVGVEGETEAAQTEDKWRTHNR